MNKKSILYLTDFYYKANGRKYYDEDIYITSQLKDDFEILICHPLHSKNYEKLTDIVIFRNTGSVMYYKEYYDKFLERMNSNKTIVYNSMTGKGDIRGKQYLLDLTKEDYPVIPTIEKLTELELLPDSAKYIIKLKNGADSIGMKMVNHEELLRVNLKNYIVQPFIDFKYEVSFYFIDYTFQYALYAPDKNKRWVLEKYMPTDEDLIFANRFIEWNTISHGIQRVDACRLKSEKLLLIELEDLNPYLSLDVLDESVRIEFISSFKKSIRKIIDA